MNPADAQVLFDAVWSLVLEAFGAGLVLGVIVKFVNRV